MGNPMNTAVPATPEWKPVPVLNPLLKVLVAVAVMVAAGVLWMVS